MFGLLRQRKLDFLDIYSDEMIMAAKTIVTQVRLLTLTINTNKSDRTFSRHVGRTHLTCLCLQCVAESVLHIEEIDTEVVTK